MNRFLTVFPTVFRLILGCVDAQERHKHSALDAKELSGGIGGRFTGASFSR